MQRSQRGEVMVLMMVAMLALMPLLSGHMGMFGSGSHQHGNPAPAGEPEAAMKGSVTVR